MHTLIDPFELAGSLPPPRAPMATLSVDIDFELDTIASPLATASVQDRLPESWSRIRCWCSED